MIMPWFLGQSVSEILSTCCSKNYDWCYFVCYLFLSLLLFLSLSLSGIIYIPEKLSHMNISSLLLFPITYRSLQRNAPSIICIDGNLYCWYVRIHSSIWIFQRLFHCFQSAMLSQQLFLFLLWILQYQSWSLLRQLRMVRFSEEIPQLKNYFDSIFVATNATTTAAGAVAEEDDESHGKNLLFFLSFHTSLYQLLV